MKIVHVIGGFFPEEAGGAQVHLRDLARCQQRSGHEVQVFARTGDGDDEYGLRRGEWAGIPVTRLTHTFRDVERFSGLFFNPEIDRRFAAFLGAETPDVVHFHLLSGLSISMIASARAAGCRTVLTLQDYWLMCPRGQRLYPETLTVCADLDRRRCARCLHALVPDLMPLPQTRGWLARRLARDPALAEIDAWETRSRDCLRRCDVVISPSRFHRDRFIEWGLERDRCRVVPHGLRREALYAEPRGRRPIRRVGFLGTVIPSKGVHVLIDAFNRLDRRDLTLDVHGEAVPYYDQTTYLQTLRDRVAPGLAVRFHGGYATADLPAILARLDLLVVPPIWWETFCLTAREGALAGLPVIAARIGGLAEAVEDGMALGFEAGNASDLAAAIARLCDDPDLRDAMSRKAHLVHDVARCAAEVEAIYRCN